MDVEAAFEIGQILFASLIFKVEARETDNK